MIRYALFLFLLPLFLCAGKLEDFADDVEYLDKSYKEVEKLPTTSAYKVEYRKRIVGARNRAYELQRAIEKLGIKKTSLDSTLNKMISCMDIDGVTKRGVSTQAGDLATHANELRRQITYLQELNYSFEANTFEDPYPESNTYEAVYRFESLLKSAYRITQGKNYVNEGLRKKYDEKKAKKPMPNTDRIGTCRKTHIRAAAITAMVILTWRLPTAMTKALPTAFFVDTSNRAMIGKTHIRINI